MSRIQVNFRLEESDKKKLDEYCRKSGTKISDFLRYAIRILTEKPELFQPGHQAIETANLPTREEFETGLGELLAEQRRTNEILSYLAEQEKAELSQDEEKIILQFENALLAKKDREKLTDYKKVSRFLLKEFPDLKEEIEDQKLYNQAVTNLIKKQLVEYSVRQRKLLWK